MKNVSLHAVQTAILDVLRHYTCRGYADVFDEVGYDNDTFKYHLRQLVRGGYVVKGANGYCLTDMGKSMANTPHVVHDSPRQYPKTTVFVLASDDERPTELSRFYLHKRLRQPFFGYWGLISFSLSWGEGLEGTIERELAKQAGLTASAHVVGVERVMDYVGVDDCIDDKLVLLVRAHVTSQAECRWRGGETRVMTLDELERQELFFKTTRQQVVRMLGGGGYQELVRQSDDSY